MAIYDTMESIKSPVGTLALGYAYNNAGFLLGAGAKGLRVAMPLTRIALQSPAGAARGQVLFLSICPFLHLRWDIWCVSKAMAKRVLKSVQSLSVH
jgi:hypothetical protein